MEKYLNQNGIFKDFDKIVKDAIDGKPEQLVELAQFIKGKDTISSKMPGCLRRSPLRRDDTCFASTRSEM